MSIGIVVVFALIILTSRIFIFKGHVSSVKKMQGKEGHA